MLDRCRGPRFLVEALLALRVASEIRFIEGKRFDFPNGVIQAAVILYPLLAELHLLSRVSLKKVTIFQKSRTPLD